LPSELRDLMLVVIFRREKILNNFIESTAFVFLLNPKNT
jgi:hypothetical protein